MMRRVGHVDSEGGPLLLADINTARLWRGTDGLEYEQMCLQFTDELQGLSWPIGDGSGIFWDTEGSGTSDIFVDENSKGVVVRAWFKDASDTANLDDLSELQINEHVPLGILDIPSGVLAILWAPENGEFVEEHDPDTAIRVTNTMASESSYLTVRVEPGTYQCLHDEVELDGCSARRCHFIRRVS